MCINLATYPKSPHVGLIWRFVPRNPHPTCSLPGQPGEQALSARAIYPQRMSYSRVGRSKLPPPPHQHTSFPYGPQSRPCAWRDSRRSIIQTPGSSRIPSRVFSPFRVVLILSSAAAASTMMFIYPGGHPTSASSPLLALFCRRR